MKLLWNSIGLPQPSEAPKMVHWAESLALLYAVFSFSATTYFIFSKSENMPFTTGLTLIITLFLFSALVVIFTLLATRRGYAIAGWIAFGLLIRPGGLTLYNIIQSPEMLRSAFTWDAVIGIGLSASAASLLLQPATREWIKQKKAERKLRKAQRKEPA